MYIMWVLGIYLMGVESDLVVYSDMLGGHSLLPDLHIQDMFLSVMVEAGLD
jgi:hypothetical protein